MNDGIAIASRSRTPGLIRRTFAALARNWHDTLYLHRRLLDAQRPWDQQGPLRWQPALGGWRVVGAYLPDDGGPAGRAA